MLAKRDAFEVISQFLRGDREAQSFLFDEVVGLTTSLLSELNEALVHGTKEEKQQILKKLKLLGCAMHMRYQSTMSKMNISKEELNKILKHFLATSPLHQEKIGRAKQELDVHKEGLDKFINHKKSKIKSIKTKSKWIRS